MTVILKVNKLTKKFGGLIANSNIDMSVEKGEILGLIGPNGAGKTTFFNCISGFYKPDEGKILLEDKDITGFSPDRTCKLGATRTFQIVKLPENMTVLEYVMTGAYARTWNTFKAKKKALEMIDFIGFGLYEQRDFFCKELTLASKKALQIACALATTPKILMLDEAMAGLTQKEQQDAVRLLAKIRDAGITLIVVEHVMEIIMSISDRIIVLNSGRKIADDIPKKVASNTKVVSAYLGG